MQEIEICKGWKIVRFDSQNWSIPATKERGGGKRDWYYGKLIDALHAIPDKMLNLTEAATLREILNQQREIKEVIERLRFTKFE